MTGPFLAYKNRDTQREEWLNVSRIVRVTPCLEPEHAGYALIWLDVTENDKQVALLADCMVPEFMNNLQQALDVAS